MSFELSQVNCALQTLLKVFKDAASSDNDKTTLNRKELYDLIQNQLPSIVQDDFDERFEGFYSCLEGGSNSKVNFKEFMCLLATIVVCREEQS
ncbi:protein S100-A1-like [Scyliorhinus torazame]|uniref:protein S100-A1-like n=1 Tax=Scyliorhinus torazame TaxID=75743 RepID=UPI003B5B90FD